MSEHVVVIGGTGGIGRALVARLVGRGAQVTIGARDAGRLHALCGELGVRGLPTDARDAGAVEVLVKAALEHAPITGAVNLAGSVLLKPAHRTSPEEWQATLAQNLDTAFHLVRSAAPAMKGGSIVLLASGAASVGLMNHEAIAAAKAGVVGLALSAAASYASRGVRVNVVSPGLVETGLTAHLTANEAARKASVGMHPLGRLGTPEDVASAIAFLLHPENAWITGQVLGVDGGLAALKRG